MGLGKPVQALAYLAASGNLPALIIPPAHLTRNCLEETLRFLRVDGRVPRVHVVHGLKPYDALQAEVYILSTTCCCGAGRRSCPGWASGR